MAEFRDGKVSPLSEALLTDLYQLNMLAAYRKYGMEAPAAFELFMRKLPTRRGFFMAAGLEQVFDFLESLAFSPGELAALEATRRFPPEFLDYLRDFRFTGDVDAMPEGTVFFPDEPVVRVVAPLPQAQFVETRLLNLIHFETVIASKAARMVLAAPGKQLVDFGLRRAHGSEAGVLAARAAYIAGFAATATVSAGIAFGIPLSGTMAHSFIQAHDDETLAFEHFAHARPDSLVLLIDTYDTERAAEKVCALAPRLAAEGITLSGVRLDSGDLGAHARKVRAILDAAGLASVRIVASGGIDEDLLLELGRQGAPIDAYGIGTALTASPDAPALDCAYKLQEYAGVPRRKRSEGKATWPGRKQVWRRRAADGSLAGDLVAPEGAAREGEPLLRPVMRGGRRIGPSPSLAESRAYAAAQLAALPEPLRRLEPFRYEVEIDADLRALAEELDARSKQQA
ncbi:MAG: nicotinate phosphoribosyltransferase [Rhodospirillales bacterium]|nr:nicotinate phosphoribosyltransferase [Rhodospirillales bacterium]